MPKAGLDCDLYFHVSASADFSAYLHAQAPSHTRILIPQLVLTLGYGPDRSHALLAHVCPEHAAPPSPNAGCDPVSLGTTRRIALHFFYEIPGTDLGRVLYQELHHTDEGRPYFFHTITQVGPSQVQNSRIPVQRRPRALAFDSIAAFCPTASYSMSDTEPGMLLPDLAVAPPA